MEIFEAKKMTDETLSGDSSISQPNDTILKSSLQETVVTTTVVETTELSVVKGIQDDKQDDVIKGVFGSLIGVDDDGGINVNCSENGTSLAMDVGRSLAGNLVLADDNGKNASGDPMDVCLSAEKQKSVEIGNRVFEFDGEDVQNWEDKSRKLAKKEGEREEEDEEDHNFVVGDFVWGKIKSHPWWPGQIYDPSDASDNAARLKRKGRILVAHFGDGSFSWCSPSQLKPFIDHFPEMSNQSDSKKFMNAVQTALDEIHGLVEAGLMCKCQTIIPVDRVGVVNMGIKDGVPVPKGNTIKILMDRIEPVGILSILKGFATMDPGTELAQIELTLLKSSLKAFYSYKGGYLVKYHDPKCIEGLEDKPVADSEMSGPWGNIDKKRKQKSVAELLKEDEPVYKTKTAKDGGGSSKRRRKALVVAVTPATDHESGSGGVVEEETMSPRQRKKSKYLSPPYLSPVGTGRLSILGSFKEPKPESEPENVPEMAAKQLDDSLKKSSGRKTRQTRGVHEGSDPPEESIDADMNAKKMLQWLLRVACDPTTTFMEKNLPVVTDFISSYRRSVFGEGSSTPTDRKRKDGGMGFIKRKLESMMEMVQGCQETEINADVKASLQGGIQEVLDKVGKIKRK